MSALVSLESMADVLVRQGLPAEYAERAMAEVIDHRRDVVEELRASGLDADMAEVEATRRLGEPSELVKKFSRQYQRRYFCGRWPLVTFLLAPIPAFFTAWIAATWASIGMYYLLGNVGAMLGFTAPSLGAKAMLKLVLIGGATAVLVPAILTVLFHRLARRAGCSWQWALLSVAQIGFLASLLCFQADFERGMIWYEPAMLRAIFFADDATTFLRSYFVQPSQILQLAAPLAALGILIWYERRKQTEILDSAEISC